MFYRSDVDDRLMYLSERYPKFFVNLLFDEVSLESQDVVLEFSDAMDIPIGFTKRLCRALTYIGDDDFMTVLDCLVDIDYLAGFLVDMVIRYYSDSFAARLLRCMESVVWVAGWRGYRYYDCVMEVW